MLISASIQLLLLWGLLKMKHLWFYVRERETEGKYTVTLTKSVRNGVSHMNILFDSLYSVCTREHCCFRVLVLFFVKCKICFRFWFCAMYTLSLRSMHRSHSLHVSGCAWMKMQHVFVQVRAESATSSVWKVDPLSPMPLPFVQDGWGVHRITVYCTWTQTSRVLIYIDFTPVCIVARLLFCAIAFRLFFCCHSVRWCIAQQQYNFWLDLVHMNWLTHLFVHHGFLLFSPGLLPNSCCVELLQSLSDKLASVAEWSDVDIFFSFWPTA